MKKITIRATFVKEMDYDEEKYGALDPEAERLAVIEDPFAFIDDARVVLASFSIETNE